MDLTGVEATVEDFASEVGVEGPVAPVGGRTQWDVGGLPDAGAREVRAPVGVVRFEPAEMVVRVLAGTAVEVLAATLAEGAQRVLLPIEVGATVGGVLAVGHSALDRLGYGPVRDVLLEARCVSSEGSVIKAGGPTVKNVSGYDLCRLLVGSLGTLALLGEVVLRTRPLPEVTRWLAGDVDPNRGRTLFHQPACVLWDGTTTWVRLDGYRIDVDAQSRTASELGMGEVDGPPALPPHRRSVQPADLDEWQGEFVAEIGVGTVHVPEAPPAVEPPPKVAELNRRVKAAFDPHGRLNPGRDVLAR